MSEEVEVKPQYIAEGPNYDPGNPDHVRRWELAGRPSLETLDGDGNPWRPTLTYELQPDGESYALIAAPAANPVTDVDIAKQYQQAYQAAEGIIFLLMGRVAPTLIQKKYCTPENVNAEGTKFMQFHRDIIQDFKNSGRHPDAGDQMYDDFVGSEVTFPWVKDATILTIFSATIPRNLK